MPNQDKIVDIAEHINPGAKDFSDVDITWFKQNP